MMLHHGADRGIAHQRGAEASQPEAAGRPPLHQAQRDGGLEQAFRGVERYREPRRDVIRSQRAFRQQIEQLEPHASEQNLRVHEAGADIEQRARPLARRRSGERKGGRPALKFRVRQPPIANGEIAVRP